MTRIIPSLASADPLRLGQQIDELKGFPYLHVDVEDGNFVPNITFGLKTIKSALHYSEKELDVHLMVTRPEDYIDDLMDLGIKKIAVHIEASQYPARYLNHIKKRGGTAGLAMNCMACPPRLIPYEDCMDYVLIMTSEPDGKDQVFNEKMLAKIREVRGLLPKHISIMADGGISQERMKDAADAGADTLIMGRTIWNDREPGRKLKALLEKLNQEEAENGV